MSMTSLLIPFASEIYVKKYLQKSHPPPSTLESITQEFGKQSLGEKNGKFPKYTGSEPSRWCISTSLFIICLGTIILGRRRATNQPGNMTTICFTNSCLPGRQNFLQKSSSTQESINNGKSPKIIWVWAWTMTLPFIPMEILVVSNHHWAIVIIASGFLLTKLMISIN